MIDISLKGTVGGFEVNASFVAPGAGVTAIFGPSACGKTSLLRAIAGLEHLHGHVKIGARTWQDKNIFVPVHMRRVGMLFQEPSLFSHLSVFGNLDFVARRHKSAPLKIAEVSDHLSLTPLLSRSVGRLSGGERQRVALARVLLSHPELLLMDEPLSSLDDASKAEILPYISSVCEYYQVPVLYVSHDRIEIASLTDSGFAMSSGRITDKASSFKDDLDHLSDGEIKALALKALRAGL